MAPQCALHSTHWTMWRCAPRFISTRWEETILEKGAVQRGLDLTDANCEPIGVCVTKKGPVRRMAHQRAYRAINWRAFRIVNGASACVTHHEMIIQTSASAWWGHTRGRVNRRARDCIRVRTANRKQETLGITLQQSGGHAIVKYKNKNEIELNVKKEWKVKIRFIEKKKKRMTHKCHP